MTWQALWPPLLMLVSAVGGVVFMAVRLRRARLIEDTPTSKIRSAAQGYVELCGFARDNPERDAPLLAPLTRQPCVWFRYRIERYQRSGKSSRWQTVDSGSSDDHFLLDDHSGHCRVDPRGADLDINTRDLWYGNARHPVSGPDRRSRGSGLGALLGMRLEFGLGGDYRYTEWRIRSGDWLYALGQFRTLHAPGSAQRTEDRKKALLNAWKQDRAALVARFDRNGDGDIDLQEWDEARRTAEQEARAQVLGETAPPAVNMLSRPVDRRQPYLIATADQQVIATRARRQALLGLAAGLTLAALVAWHTYGA